MTADDEFDPTVPTLDVVVSRLGTTTTIQFVGECDLAQREELQATVREVFAQRPECVVLDLSRLRFIDSTGIHAVIEVSRRASADDVRLVIVPGMPPVQ